MTSVLPTLAPTPRSWLRTEIATQWPKYLLMLVLVGILLALMVYPVLKMISAAFVDGHGLTFGWFRTALADETFRGRLINSLALAFVVTLLCNLRPCRWR